ncbi:MAG: type II toxin-antitoxin system RelE/ParE family toxin [Endomicrobiaceae bacterium]|jgi:putative addiction module killer protein|nr:type II toxin-antitoxin system RelE/ParE family toxin [Endomicrobiaceae bacterium]MDD4165671.1 type II toxin-antitoxin system RelE/ParE family toxin [Endomicrobiaceae bacterium]
MIVIKQTDVFEKWFKKLKNFELKNIIIDRMSRVKLGNFGDFKNLKGNLFELRFNIQAGVRIYFTKRNGEIVLLLNAGDKSSQSEDIKKARQLMDLYD